MTRCGIISGKAAPTLRRRIFIRSRNVRTTRQLVSSTTSRKSCRANRQPPEATDEDCRGNALAAVVRRRYRPTAAIRLASERTVARRSNG